MGWVRARLDGAEDAGVDDGDEQRDADLAANVGEDLPLGLGVHTLAPRVVAVARFAREQERQDEEDVD